MNEAASAQRRDNEPLNLGTEFTIELYDLARARTTYSIEQFIAALEMTTTLTSLSVDFNAYDPLPENNRRIVQPLCRCLSNLRCQDEHHPLRALTLQSAGLCIGLCIYSEMLDVFEQFLIAAKYGGIYHLEVFGVDFLPVQFLVEFCHNNNNLKVLAVTDVTFSDGKADPSVHLVLDKLVLKGVTIDNSIAVTAFAPFISRMTVQALELGKVWTDDDDDDDDLQMTKRILSEIKVPSVNQLELNRFCRIEHFKAALEAGTTSLVELDFVIVDEQDDYLERLELLTHFIRRAVQLNSLTIRTDLRRNKPITMLCELLRVIELCATVTRIRVLGIVGQRDFSRYQVLQLQAISARNEELASFIASPSTCPTDKVLGLMRQFENCPTGRYMLTRSLPGVFLFEMIKSTVSPTTESKQKKRKTE